MHNCCTLDELLWVATYENGTQLLECDGEADHAFADIDLEHLVQFALVPRNALENPEDETQFVFKRSPGMTLIFFRRRQFVLEVAGDGIPESWQVIHVIGFKIGSLKVYQYILPNGTTLLTDDYAAL